MPATLSSLKLRLGPVAAARIGDPDLAAYLTDASDRSNQSDVVLTLALAWCYQRLASEAAANLKYSQADESVDKTAEAAQWRALFDSTWASLPETIRESGAALPDVGTFGADPTPVEV
jgi:hypothetical protein